MRSLSSLFIRFLIFGFWIFVIGLFLLLPTIGSFFTSQKSLTIFTWPLLLDAAYLKKFEQETGIKLYITYFENGPSLITKLNATQAKGYDIIFPDDHSLKLLIEQKLLKKIDHSKLSFWHNLNSQLLHTYADPNNDYSIPYYWAAYGIGYNKQLIKDVPTGWQNLFEPGCSGSCVCMTDDPREAILITAQHLFGSIDALKNKEAQELVKQTLIKQKKFVEVYTISRADNLLQNKSCGLAVIMSPEIYRLAKEESRVDIIIPQSSFIVLDSLAVPIGSQKEEMIYTFINYLYQNKVIKHHIENFGYCSPLMGIELENQEKFCPLVNFKSFNFLQDVISDDEMNNLWIEVLAS